MRLVRSLVWDMNALFAVLVSSWLSTTIVTPAVAAVTPTSKLSNSQTLLRWLVCYTTCLTKQRSVNVVDLDRVWWEHGNLKIFATMRFNQNIDLIFIFFSDMAEEVTNLTVEGTNPFIYNQISLCYNIVIKTFQPSLGGRWIFCNLLQKRRKRDYRQRGAQAFPLRGRWHEVPDEVFLRLPPRQLPPLEGRWLLPTAKDGRVSIPSN